MPRDSLRGGAKLPTIPAYWGTQATRATPSVGAIRSSFVSRGTVAFWHNEDGWGAITAPDRPGLGFVHFSNLQGVEGYRDLVPGESVEFEWLDDFEQDGCQWRVGWVRPI
jgi:cold shock CspA family protein